MRPGLASREVLVLVLIELAKQTTQAAKGTSESWRVVLGVSVSVVMILHCLSQLQRVGGEKVERDSVVGVAVMGFGEGRSTRGGCRWQSETGCSICQLEMCWCYGVQTMRLLCAVMRTTQLCQRGVPREK